MIINKEKNFISIVAYARNNEHQIDNFLKNIVSVLENKFEKYEIIFVDDSSSDKTVEKIQENKDIIKNGVLQIINMSFYQGIEPSMKAGVDLAIGDFVYEFDNIKTNFDMNLIMKIYYHSLKGYDIVSAVPSSKNKFTSRVFYYLFNKYSKSNYGLQTETFRILSRRAINRINDISQTIPYRKAIYANSGLKMDYIEYKCENNVSSYEQEDNSLKRDIAINSLILFTNIGYKVSQIFSLIMVIFTVVIGIYTVETYLTYDKIVEGWTTLMGMICICFFGVFLVLAIVIRYLNILLNLVFKKQQYLISSIEKLV